MKEFNYKINGNPYKVVVHSTDDSLVELEVNGAPYTVEFEKKPETVAKPLKRETTSNASPENSPAPTAAKPSVSAGKNAIKSPLPGIIVDIRCRPGDEVKKGQPIMILEAMKMENNVLANADGKITEILVQKGNSVLEGDELAIIE